MREIKFRAWSDAHKCMGYLDQLWNNHWYNTPSQTNSAKVVWDNNNNTMGSGKWFHLMQFTNLYDRTGKEIYEGDILSFFIPVSDSLSKGGHKIIVSFDRGAFGFEPTHPDDVNADDRTWKSFFIQEKGSTWNGNYFTVIGNIYENPELLK